MVKVTLSSGNVTKVLPKRTESVEYLFEIDPSSAGDLKLGPQSLVKAEGRKFIAGAQFTLRTEPDKALYAYADGGNVTFHYAVNNFQVNIFTPSKSIINQIENIQEIGGTTQSGYDLANLKAQILTGSTTGIGSGNAAQIQMTERESLVDVFVDVSGAATLTVEVSKDGSNWLSFDSKSYSAAAEETRQYQTAFEYIRAYVDANITKIVVSAKSS